MNKAYMIGRLTKDIEFYGKYAKINLACKLKEDETLFLPIICFNKTAELAKEWLHKGDLISTEVIIKNNNYEDKNGNKKYEFEFITNKINFIQVKGKLDDKTIENKTTFTAEEVDKLPW